MADRHRAFTMWEMTAPAQHSRDRVLDWQEEMVRLAPELPSLPPAARELVLELVVHFLAEDAELALRSEAVVVPLFAAAA